MNFVLSFCLFCGLCLIANTHKKAQQQKPKNKHSIKLISKFFIMSTEFDKKKTFQIEAIIALITKMALTFSWDYLALHIIAELENT